MRGGKEAVTAFDRSAEEEGVCRAAENQQKDYNFDAIEDER
jgi:hypothetical protein